MRDESNYRPVISVTVPFLDAVDTLKACVEAVVAQVDEVSVPVEVILSDNGSGPACKRLAANLAERHEAVRVIDGSNAPGAGPARNAGAASARGRVLAFTDADDMVLPGWLATIASMVDEPDLFATGPVPRFTEATPQEQMPHLRDTAPMRHMRYLRYADGTNLVVAAELFHAVGGFEPRCRTGQDVDLSWRLQQAGVPLQFVRGLRVAARWRATSAGSFRQYRGYGRGDALVFQRHRQHGAKRDTFARLGRVYAGLVLRLPLLIKPDVRERWMKQAGRRLGRLEGSIRYRVWLP